MTTKIETALQNVNVTYEELIDIVNTMAQKCTKSIDEVVAVLTKSTENLSNDDIRQYLLTLSTRSYSLSEIKEKASLKAECAEAIKKAGYATKFATAEGTVGAKESSAFLETQEALLAQYVFDTVAAILKAKTDEAHRIVDTLKNILITRLQEAKLPMQEITVGAVGEKTYLAE